MRRRPRNLQYLNTGTRTARNIPRWRFALEDIEAAKVARNHGHTGHVGTATPSSRRHRFD